MVRNLFKIIGMGLILITVMGVTLEYIPDYIPKERVKDMNEIRIKGQVIKTKFREYIWYILPSIEPNTLIGVDKENVFTKIQITPEGELKIKPILKDFPGLRASAYGFDDEAGFVWAVRGRSVYFLDTINKKKGKCFATGDGSERISNVILVDKKNSLFLIKILGEYPYKYYILYDFNNSDIVFTSEEVRGCSFFPFVENFMLCRKYKEKSNILNYWLSDYKLNEKIENKLTKELTKLNIDFVDYVSGFKPFSLKKRIALGTNRLNDKLMYYTVRWDEKFEDIKIEPLILQLPGGRIIRSGVVFSQDGSFMQSMDRSLSPRFPPEFLIYHVSDIYPQGLSLPIHLDYTKESNVGAFFTHDVWGHCYAEHDYEQPYQIKIYKLNDGLKLLAEQAKSAVSP